MKNYMLILEDEMLKQIKIESAKADLTMREFIVEAVKKLIEANKKKGNV
jgi:hypothetical protein